MIFYPSFTHKSDSYVIAIYTYNFQFGNIFSILKKNIHHHYITTIFPTLLFSCISSHYMISCLCSYPIKDGLICYYQDNGVNTYNFSFFCFFCFFFFLNIFIDHAITVVPSLPPLHSILPTPLPPTLPPIVHVHGSYL